MTKRKVEKICSLCKEKRIVNYDSRITSDLCRKCTCSAKGKKNVNERIKKAKVRYGERFGDF